MKKKIKIMMVDDSVLFRSQGQKAFEGHTEIEVVAVASNGKIALEKLQGHHVDLVVLDLEMPVMDGIETLKAIKEKFLQVKIILFSSVNQASAERTLQGLKFGADDFVPKPGSEVNGLLPSQKIKMLLEPRILALFPEPHLKIESNHEFKMNDFLPDVLVIASSTGGPNALSELFKYLQEPLPFPILISQHMPAVFTTALAQRLGSLCGKKSLEGLDGELIQANQIYLAPGNFHMFLKGDKQAASISLSDGPLRNFVRPCADYLFESAASIYGSNTLGLVLTGMGRDGADGTYAIKAQQGSVLIQDQESSVVFGMPGAVYESKNFDFMGNPHQLAEKILRMSKKRMKHVA